MHYVDSNVFILAILDESKLGEKAAQIIESVKDNNEHFCTSCLTFDEVVYVIKGYLEKELFYENMESLISLDIRWLDVNAITIREAIKIIKIYNLKPRDAIHMATMKINKVNTLISEDSDFDKVKDVKRIKILDFK